MTEKRTTFEGEIVDGVVCVSGTIAAKILGISPTNLRYHGLEPIGKTGRTSWYSVPDLVASARGKDVAPKARDRLSDLKAREMELDLAEREAALRRPEQIQDALNALGSEVVAQSRGIGQSLRHELGLPAEAGDAIQARIDQLLSQLATVEAHLGEPPRTAGGVNGDGVGRQ